MKKYLLTPGPTALPPYVRKALSKQIIHHRTSQFQEILKVVEENLKYLFQTQNDVYILTSSGTGAMETAVANTVNRGDKVLIVDSGKFGERWTELSKAYGAEVQVFKVEWGKAVNPKDIEDVLNKDKSIKVVFATHCETSTAVTNDVEALGRIVKNSPAILVVDAISSLGSLDLKTDTWSIDIVVSGSQKGLMLPPGLAFISVSPKAMKLVGDCKNPRYYFDLNLYKKAWVDTDTPFTPAISTIIALDEVLKDVRARGLDKVFAQNRKIGKAAREAVKALGLELFAPSAYSDSVTSVKVPQGIDGGKLVNTMRDKYGVTMAGGQGSMKGKIFRIAHMGFVLPEDLIAGLKVLEKTLLEMGYKFEKGSSVKAAEKVLGK